MLDLCWYNVYYNVYYTVPVYQVSIGSTSRVCWVVCSIPASWTNAGPQSTLGGYIVFAVLHWPPSRVESSFSRSIYEK